MSVPVLRHALKGTLAIAPEVVRRQAARLPFSRFHSVLRWLEGPEVIDWHSFKVEVEPSEPEGYLQYFLGVSGATAVWEIEALAAAIGSGPCTLFDVGAHAGVLSLFLASRCPHLQVVGFEPDERVAARMTRNLALNPLLARRIQVIESAVGNEDGAHAYYPGGHGAWECGSLVPRQGVDARQVSTLRLDSFCRLMHCYPDVLKIDVEGAERDVLEGLSGLAANQRPQTIFVEVHGFLYGDDGRVFSQAIEALLRRMGYQLSEISEAGERPARPSAEWPGRLHIVARRVS
jgi:FkbM family methyltransferase